MQCLCVTPAAGPGSNKHQRRRDCAQPHALTRSERAPYVVNLAYRWFCGLSIDDKVPVDHAAQRAACRVLPPALLHRLIILAGARTRIGRLGVPIASERIVTNTNIIVENIDTTKALNTDSREAASERVIELCRHQLVSDLCGSRCDELQTVIAH